MKGKSAFDSDEYCVFQLDTSYADKVVDSYNHDTEGFFKYARDAISNSNFDIDTMQKRSR